MAKKEKTAEKMETEKEPEKIKETKTQAENQKPKKAKETKTQTENEKTKMESTTKTTKQSQKTNKSDNKQTTKKAETQLQEKKEQEIQEVVRKEIKASKKIPKEELGKINTSVFKNICLAVIVMFYLNFIILGFINIDNNIFITDLKVFGMALLVISIGIFEYAYKKDSGRHAIHGVEMLVLAFVTMAFVYVNLMWASKFIYIVAFITYIFAIYYVAKSIIIYKKLKKEYFLSAMKEIIKK